MSKNLKSYHPLVIIVVVFLFLFLGALRLDPWVSLIFAFVDTVWLTLFVFLFVKLFQSALFKKCPRIINMFTTVLLLAFFISLLCFNQSMKLTFSPGRCNHQQIYSGWIIVHMNMYFPFCIRFSNVRSYNFPVYIHNFKPDSGLR